MLPMAGIFYLNKKAVKTLVVSQLNRKFAAKNNNEELWKKNYRLYI